MIRLALLALLAFPFAACADPGASAPGGTLDDSLAALRAEIDSFQTVLDADRARTDASAEELDSLRRAMDATGRAIEAARRQTDSLGAELRR